MRILLTLFFCLVFAACTADQSLGRPEYEEGAKYLNGIGREKDPVKAAASFMIASDKGNAEAQMALGYLYLQGSGVPKDESKAFQLFKRAADQGNIDAIYNTGLAYVKGIGVKIDFAEAFKWFRKGALQGDAGSQFNLGIMYVNGEGVVRDPVLAYAWFKQAANGKFPGAKGAMEVARTSLSSDQAASIDSVVEAIETSIAKPAPASEGVTVRQPL